MHTFIFLWQRLHHPQSGRTVDCSTTEPGILTYFSCAMKKIAGKCGATYGPFEDGGICLIPERYPDSVNKVRLPFQNSFNLLVSSFLVGCICTSMSRISEWNVKFGDKYSTVLTSSWCQFIIMINIILSWREECIYLKSIESHFEGIYGLL